MRVNNTPSIQMTNENAKTEVGHLGEKRKGDKVSLDEYREYSDTI